mgnify:CR=1 FL=1
MLFLKDFNYQLPSSLIAQEPVKPRDHARLLCLGRADGQIRHSRFDEIGLCLQAGDVLVINNSRVFPARLVGKKAESGGRVEIFLHKPIDKQTWECLVGGRVHAGVTVKLGRDLIAYLQNDQGDGTWLVKFNQQGHKFWRTLNHIGQMPLPPYIKPGANQRLDRCRYQTVYAEDKNNGSVAAPTAGLHFTARLLAKLRRQGIIIAPVTLHVGLGTFASIKSENIIEHQMHEEFIQISQKTAQILAKAKKDGRRIVAVGTTSCRTLESYGQAIKSGRFAWGQAYQDWTKIFIYPGYEFQVIDALITNFHLPKSSLLLLVSALAGPVAIRRVYQEAIAQKYRFYSYGDAMFIG